MTLVLPWACVTALRMEPVGPINAAVFGLRWVEGNTFHVAEPRRISQFRGALGRWVDSPTGLRKPSKTPWFTALCEVHRALTEEQ